MIGYIRDLLWRILGIDYSHILKVVDYVYLKEDAYTKIGYKSYSNNAWVFRWSDAPIEIGKYCAIADGVRFIVDNDKHKVRGGVSSYPFKFNSTSNKRGIKIGNDVWCGQGCVLLPGITIGDGATIAAGAVVNSDVPDYCVFGGVPAKILYHKCSDHEKEAMKRIAWWNWDDQQIKNCQSDFSLTIAEFIGKHDVK